jgi:hypothetical protein
MLTQLIERPHVALSKTVSIPQRRSYEKYEGVGLITLDSRGNCLKIIGKNSGFRDESFLWSHSTPPHFVQLRSWQAILQEHLK